MFKFLIRLIKWSLVFIGTCFLQLAGALILLPVVYLQPIGTLRIPSYLKWLDAADSYLGRDTSVYQAVSNSGKWNRYTWLAWRNPINYFNFAILGFQIKNSITHQYNYQSVEGAQIGNSTGQQPGRQHSEADIDGDIRFQYLLIYRYSSTRCIRFIMGHKIDRTYRLRFGEWIPWRLTFNPFCTYSGI